MSKEVPAPPPGDIAWQWYNPAAQHYESWGTTCEIKCYPCDVAWRELRNVVHPRCFACGKFKKRPYKVIKL